MKTRLNEDHVFIITYVFILSLFFVTIFEIRCLVVGRSVEDLWVIGGLVLIRSVGWLLVIDG